MDLAPSREVYRTWLSLARPASGDLRRPLWIFRQVKPSGDAYRLPEDTRTRRAREAARSGRWSAALEMASLLDWSPQDVWGTGRLYPSSPPPPPPSPPPSPPLPLPSLPPSPSSPPPPPPPPPPSPPMADRFFSHQPNVPGKGIIASYNRTFWALVVGIGLIAGIAGAALMELLHAIEHLAWSYDSGSFFAWSRRPPPRIGCWYCSAPA